jgi:hypothetical protein
MFRSLTEFLRQAPEAAEPVEPNVSGSEDGAQDIDWSASLEQSINAVWNDASDTEAAVEDFDEPEDDVDDSAGWDDEDELELDESEEAENIDKDDEPADELTVSTGVDTVDSGTDDTEGLWDLLLESFGESAEEGKEEPSSSANTDELERLKQTVDTLVAWQSAVQEYLQTSIEAENIRTVAQQLASLGVILPDEQIQEIARTSQQLGIPPSVLLKAKAYDYTMQTMRQQEQVPYPFMVNTPSASSTPSPSSPSSLIPNARPFRPEEPRTQRTGFTRFEEFLRQMGISE